MPELSASVYTDTDKKISEETPPELFTATHKGTGKTFSRNGRVIVATLAEWAELDTVIGVVTPVVHLFTEQTRHALARYDKTTIDTGDPYGV